MMDLASIRNASFSLTPTGYSPEEVDQFLVELAESDPASVDLAHLRNASFSLTPTGYNPEEVDEFLGSIADQLAAAPAPLSEQVEPESSAHETDEAEEQHQTAPVAEHEPAGWADHEAHDGAVAEPAEEAEVVAEHAPDQEHPVAAEEHHVEAEAEHYGDDHAAAEEQQHVAAEQQPEFEPVAVEPHDDEPAHEEAPIAEVLGGAEARRREADELLATAADAQAAMLASFDQARTSLIQAAERSRVAPPVQIVSSGDEDVDEHDATAAA